MCASCFAFASTDSSLRRSELDSVFIVLENNISGNTDSIIIQTKNLLEECKKTGYESGIGKAYYILGKSNIVGAFNYPAAFDYIYRAKKIFEKNGLDQESAKCNIQLGLINYLQRSFVEAETYFVAAMKTFYEKGDTVRWRRTAYLTSLCSSESENFKRADSLLAIARRYMFVGKDSSGIREYFYGTGIYFARQNKNDSAIYYFLKAADRFDQKNEPIATQLFFGEIAQAYYLKGNETSAREYADKVIDIGYIHNSVRGIVQAHHLLYKIEFKSKNYKKASEHLSKFVDLKDSMFNERKSFELASVKSKYAIEKAEQENQLLMAKQTAIQESQVQRQRFLKNLVIVGCSFLIILVLFLINTNNLKKKKNAELAASLSKLKETQAQLIRQEKLASMGKLSAGIAHEIRNPINFITNFSELSEELLTELSVTDSDQERDDLIKGLQDSMEKIKIHGKRADSIVKSMLDHSRSAIPERELCDFNLLCEEHLSMAFNAIRVGNPAFQCQVQTNLSPQVPKMRLASADIGRVLLNVFNNAFYAMEEKKNGGSDFSPKLNITTNLINNRVVLIIQDNGNGIPDKVRDQIFEPFFTTKPAGQGTGLGLSISNEIIKSHQGELSVESRQGEYSRFIISLPV